MNKRPGHVEVTTEVNYCSFCDRVRNLRREEHHLGTLVRTVITCETCHRTLSSTMGVAASPSTAEVETEAKPQQAKRAGPATNARAAPAKPKAAPGARRAPNSTKTRSAKPK